MSPIETLRTLLKPAGGGLYLVSTGRADQLTLQRRLYDAPTDDAVTAKFFETLERIAGARAFILGIPSDVGAGFRRGASLGPQGIRTAMLDALPDWPERLHANSIVDIGDVFVVPQLLHDDMLSDAQKMATRRAIYKELPEAAARELPVSPLSIAERALDCVFALNPTIAPIVLGGDHSTAWPVVSSLARVRKDHWGIVQPDAHTDLLEERLGIKYCFATWSYHANELLGRDGRLVQVGTRATRFDRGHWEKGLNVRQFWAEECRRDPQGVLNGITQHLSNKGISKVYFSNDIDGTDSAWADATGTPEPEGLDPDFVIELIRTLGREVGILGGDVMEVAPPLKDKPDSATRTLALAARYLRETISAIVGATV